MNISSSISKVEAALKNQTDETKKVLHKKLDMELSEKFSYLDLNARRFASGKIDLETSQFLYNKLMSYEGTSLTERIIITELLMGMAVQ